MAQPNFSARNAGVQSQRGLLWSKLRHSVVAACKTKMSAATMATLKAEGGCRSVQLDGVRADFQIVPGFFRFTHGFLYFRRVHQFTGMTRHIQKGHIVIERS